MRALVALALLAAFGAILATATRGGGGAAGAPIGWTGYAPLGKHPRATCTPLAAGAEPRWRTLPVVTVLPNAARRIVPSIRPGSTEVVCTFVFTGPQP